MQSIGSVIRNFFATFWGSFPLFVGGLALGILTGPAWTALGHRLTARTALREKKRRDQAVSVFFGLDSKPVCIVHSATQDLANGRWNYPSCDILAANVLRRFFEQIDKELGINLFIGGYPEFKDGGQYADKVKDSHLVILGGPKRNELFRALVTRPPEAFRYEMVIDNDDNEIKDSKGIAHPKANVSKDSEGHDYALIQAMPRTGTPGLRIVAIAGTHGTGTLGGAQYLTSADTLATLNDRSKNGCVQVLLEQPYLGSREKIGVPTEV